MRTLRSFAAVAGIVAMASLATAHHALAQAVESSGTEQVVQAASTEGTSQASATAESEPNTVVQHRAGPTIESARRGMAPQRVASNEALPPANHVGAGENVALMAVGGAALVAGLIMGGDAGTLVAVGGLVVGLYGLYNYLK